MSLASRLVRGNGVSDAVSLSLKGFISSAGDALNSSEQRLPSNVSEHESSATNEQSGVDATVNISKSRSEPHDLSTSLRGLKAAIKDNICSNTTPQLPTTCDSKILGPGFLSPYNATVVELLGKAACKIIGKTSMDEFGMGSHSTRTTFGEVYQEDSDGGRRSAGGSSGGSAIAVQQGACDFALGTDTGGSVRLPAAYTGVIGFKPSYGLLSRWGVIAYANSLDTVGILGKDVDVIRRVFGTLNKHDPKDPTSLSLQTRSRLPRRSSSPTTVHIGVPLECNITELDQSVRTAWLDTLSHLRSLGHTVHPISLPRTKQALSAYYVLAPSEASSNLAKYDGIRYGRRESGADNARDGILYSGTRGEGFGEEVKRRILLGSYSLSAAAIDNYFIQAQKVRRLVQKDFDHVFSLSNPLHDDNEHDDNLGTTNPSEMRATTTKTAKVDYILLPTAPTPPPYLSELQNPEKNPVGDYINDVFTVPASLAGLPAISVPAAIGGTTTGEATGPGRNIGMQIIGQFGSDDGVLDLAGQITRTSVVR